MWRGDQILGFLISLSALHLSGMAQVAAPNAEEGPVVDTTICQLRSSPHEFDHKRIRVNAYFRFGFEDQSMHDPSCTEDSSSNVPSSNDFLPEFWVEIAKGAEVEGVTGYRPLIEDEKLQQFYDVERQHAGQMLRAVVVGTFYGARSSANFVRGYGHRNCCHLFVVSQVESVQTDYSPDLDYSSPSYTDYPRSCYSRDTFDTPTDAEIRSWQLDVNKGNDRWRLDPMKVAQEQLQAMRFGRFKNTRRLAWQAEIPDDPRQARSFLAPPDDRPTRTLLEADSQSFRKTYEYIAHDRKSRLIVVVARRYWLEDLAGSPDNVIWAPIDAAKVTCFAPGEVPKAPPD